MGITVEQAKELLGNDEFTLFADGLEDAFLGLGQRCHQVVAVYDIRKCLDILALQSQADCEFASHHDCDHHTEAEEWFFHNVVGAWMGDGTPIFLDQSIPEDYA